MKKKELNKLREKYNVFDWMYVPSPIFCTTDGKDWMVQDYNNIESLFENAEGKLVCIYKIDHYGFSGRMVIRGTIVDKKHLEKTMNRDTSWDDPQLSDGDMSNRHKNALKNTFPDLEIQKEVKLQTQLEELNDYLRMIADMDKIGIRRKLFLLEGYMNKVISQLKN
jgi:hypothetical protein